MLLATRGTLNFQKSIVLLRSAPKRPHYAPFLCSKKNGSSISSPVDERRILLVGEGDFSYAADACTRIHKQGDRTRILATTLDGPEDLAVRFPSSSEMIRRIHEAGGLVTYCVDATDLSTSTTVAESAPFDVIRFNFPHIPGKSNNKLNRDLLRNFLASAGPLVRKDFGMSAGGKSKIRGGCVRIVLAEGQGGTGSHGERGTGQTDMGIRDANHWTRSWMASVAAAEAGSGLVLSAVKPFHTCHFDDGMNLEKKSSNSIYYVPQGARGTSRRFNPRKLPMMHEFTPWKKGHRGTVDKSILALQHCFVTELHCYVPTDWDPQLDDATLECALRAEINRQAQLLERSFQDTLVSSPSGPFYHMDRAMEQFANVHDYVYPCGQLRIRAWRVVFRDANLSRKGAAYLWDIIRHGAAGYMRPRAYACRSDELDKLPIKLRNKSSCTVSKAQPSWVYR